MPSKSRYGGLVSLISGRKGVFDRTVARHYTVMCGI